MSEEIKRENIILDSQILNSIQLCAYKTDLAFNQDLRLPIVAEPLESGDLFHKLMECYYSDLRDAGTEITYDNQKFKESIDKAITLGEEYSVNLSIDTKQVSEIIYQFKENITFFRMDGWKILEVEKSFITLLYEDENLRIFLTGKIDVIAEVPYVGLSVIDHKTSKRRQEPEPLSNQFTLYSYATGIPDVLINRVGFQKTLAPEERFQRQNLHYTNYQIEHWKENTIWWAKYYYFCLKNNSWPENRTSCDKFGGCQFDKICKSATEEGRENMITSNFIVGPKWDVTGNLKREKK